MGVRVAGRVASQRIAGTGPSPGAPQMPVSRVAGQAAGRATKGLARGVGGFLRPFHRVGTIVFLEVAGVFFFVFVLVFAQNLWRIRAAYAAGPDHQKFVITVVLLALFLYLSASSFWRARRK